MTTDRRGYAQTPLGRLHYAEAGAGPAVLMLHQTPRSLDEFAELQDELAVGFRTLAMDMPGFGLSEPVPAPQSIETMAEGAGALLDALGIEEAVVIGHHTGAVVAQELAVRRPDLVRALVLSAMPWVDDARRRKTTVPVDEAEPTADGSHLVDLWRQRRPYYPPGRPDLLDRFIRDALAPGIDPAEGHRAVGRYLMDQRIGEVRAPTLLIAADLDPFSCPALDPVRDALIGASVVRIHHVATGTIPLMETCAAEVATAMRSFLSDIPHPS